MAKKSGRPKKAASSLKTRYLQVRVGEAEKRTFDAAAELAGIDVSAWVRERLRTIARKELEQSGRQVEFLRQRPQG